MAFIGACAVASTGEFNSSFFVDAATGPPEEKRQRPLSIPVVGRGDLSGGVDKDIKSPSGEEPSLPKEPVDVKKLTTFFDRELLNNMKVGLGENLGGVPVELMIKDLYPLIVHKGLGGLLSKLVYKIQSMTTYRRVVAVAHVVMYELERYLFKNGTANRQVMKQLAKKLEGYLREWWDTTPEDPESALEVGIWKALLRLFTEELQETLRGSPKMALMSELLFDEKMVMIKKWSDGPHRRIMALDSYRERNERLRELTQAEEGTRRRAKSE